MKEQLEAAVGQAVAKLFNLDLQVELTRPDAQFGDFATNVALQLAKPLGQNPREVAEAIKAALLVEKADIIKDASIAGPGFINLTVSDKALASALEAEPQKPYQGMKVLLEYSCPNAFKELHTGHLYQTIVGDALGRLLEQSGAKVFRANFGGDVGLHVAKCLYGILQEIGENNLSALDDVIEAERPAWISAAYVRGAAAYETDEAAKQQIGDINLQIYAFHSEDDHENPLAQIYWTCRQWSYDYFIAFYESIEAHAFDKYYPESTTTEPGLEVVRAHTGQVFSESDGAIVYKGEDAGLHTRVFVTSKGLPTYETKDLGVIFTEVQDFAYDRRIIMTGNDQFEYMKVVFAALGAIDSQLAAKQTHLTNGTIRFGGGQRMSSRLGNVTRAVDVIEEVAKVTTAVDESTKRAVTLGAIKYSFLKHRLGGDIAFDIQESVSMEGNSGPYLQYAHARARSIIRKAASNSAAPHGGLQDDERKLAMKLSEYAETVERATTELMPHHVCNYLYELAQTFNRFYENNRVIGDDREAVRLVLVGKYADTLKQGLEILGITAPEQM